MNFNRRNQRPSTQPDSNNITIQWPASQQSHSSPRAPRLSQFNTQSLSTPQLHSSHSFQSTPHGSAQPPQSFSTYNQYQQRLLRNEQSMNLYQNQHGSSAALVPGQANSGRSGSPTGSSTTEALDGQARVVEAIRTGLDVETPDRLIVGMDFGTTFSGVAVVYTGTPNSVDIIKMWPGGNGITSDKVPTELSYVEVSDGGLSSSEGPEVKWGFQFKPEEPRLRCIKLFLDRSQRMPFYVSQQETAAQLKRFDKSVLDAVTDYLKQIHRHTIDTLTRRYGEGFMESTKISWVLTCPAVWSDAAKNTTREAAEKAGMGNKEDIRMISEPEAAAVWTLAAVQTNNMRVGDNFVVCDAGGGTVDLIAYKIVGTSPLRVEESAVGIGGLCGSVFLNYRFEEFVKGRLGEERWAMVTGRKGKSWATALKYWEEHVKRNFAEGDEEISIPLPGVPDDEKIGLECGFLVIGVADVKKIFDPVVRQVCELVQAQVDVLRVGGGNISGIILVGGFGQSDYLYRRLKAHFSPPPPYSEQPGTEGVAEGLATEGIEVMQPIHAWTAVVRGAVLRGLEAGMMVITRRARMHYGTPYATIYDEQKHDVSERYWSPLWERWVVAGRMHWHIAKGTPISSHTPVTFEYTRNFRPGQSLVVTDELLVCEDDEAPAKLVEAGENGERIRKVCTLRTNLGVVPRRLFKQLVTTQGLEFLSLSFDMEMRMGSAGLEFELKVGGVAYGRVETEFH